MASNYRTTADAEIPFLLHVGHPWPRAADCGRKGVHEIVTFLTRSLKQGVRP